MMARAQAAGAQTAEPRSGGTQAAGTQSAGRISAGAHMAQVLEATGLYDLSGSTQVEGELAAYAAGFALVEDALEDLLGELFVSTAQGPGLERWEKLLWGDVLPGEAQTRRRELLAGLGAHGGMHTKEDFESLLPAAGLEGTVTETEDGGLAVAASLLGNVTEDQARLALSRLLPAHLAWELTLSGGETE